MKITVAVTGASGAIYARRLLEKLEQAPQVERIYLIKTVNGEAVWRYELGADRNTCQSSASQGDADMNIGRDSIQGSDPGLEKCHSDVSVPGEGRAQTSGADSALGSDSGRCHSHAAGTDSGSAVGAGQYCSHSFEAEKCPRQGLGSDSGQAFSYESIQGSIGYSGLNKITVFDNDDFFTPVASGSAAADAMVIVPCSMGMVGRIACGVSNDLISRAADVMLKERLSLILVVRETPFSLIHLQNMVTLSAAGAVILPASPSFYHLPETIEQLVDSVVERILKQLSINNTNQYQWQQKK